MTKEFLHALLLNTALSEWGSSYSYRIKLIIIDSRRARQFINDITKKKLKPQNCSKHIFKQSTYRINRLNDFKLIQGQVHGGFAKLACECYKYSQF